MMSYLHDVDRCGQLPMFLLLLILFPNIVPSPIFNLIHHYLVISSNPTFSHS